MGIASSPRSRSQHGYALMMLLTTLVIFTTLLTASFLKRVGRDAERSMTTSAALSQAVDALIGYATVEDNSPGTLPCPDVTGDGIADWDFGGSNPCSGYIGRLPWRTLGIGDLRDADGECLWYALSPAFRNTIPTSQRGVSQARINAATQGELTLIGQDGAPVLAASAAIALVVAPGSPLRGQSRDRTSNSACGGNLAAENYLDIGPDPARINNATGNGTGKMFVAANVGDDFNDRVAAVTGDRLFASVNLRVLAELRGTMEPNGLRKYYATYHEYPWAASGSSGGGQVDDLTSGLLPFNAIAPFVRHTPFSGESVTPSEWLLKNDWYSTVQYQVAPAFQPHTAYAQQCGPDGAGCLAVAGNKQAQARLQIGAQSLGVCMVNDLIATCP